MVLLSHEIRLTFVNVFSGCICCTLRADLLEEIATLAEAGQYEYVPFPLAVPTLIPQS